ncbi:MAG: flagellar basal body rod protein FlgB [Candidatus Riflebacteria bacterium]|nr:flagellar basal body rod protein FlgB [Candidatus Riflebacteria bacterium]
MFRDITETLNFRLLQKAMDVATLRHKAISNNISNVNTPGFKRKIITFEEEMAKVLDKSTDLAGNRTDDRHIPIEDVSFCDLQPRIITDRAHVMRNDKNNIDIDTEMSDLAKNTMTYQFYATRINGMFTHLNEIITKGAR